MGLCAEFVGARTETVASELQYIMANLVKRPHMQEAVQFILVAPARRSPTWVSWWPVCVLRSNDSHGHGRELQICGGASTIAMASGSKRLWCMGRGGRKNKGRSGTRLFTRGLPVAATTRNGGGGDYVFSVRSVGSVKARTGPKLCRA